MVCLGLEPRVGEWKAQTNPLSYLSQYCLGPIKIWQYFFENDRQLSYTFLYPNSENAANNNSLFVQVSVKEPPKDKHNFVGDIYLSTKNTQKMFFFKFTVSLNFSFALFEASR